MKREKFIIKWKVSKHRRDKRSGALSPGGDSRYIKSLKEGAIF